MNVRRTHRGRAVRIWRRFDRAEPIRAIFAGEKMPEAEKVRIEPQVRIFVARVTVSAVCIGLPDFHPYPLNRFPCLIANASGDIYDLPVGGVVLAVAEQQVVVHRHRFEGVIERTGGLSRRFCVPGCDDIAPRQHGGTRSTCADHQSASRYNVAHRFLRIRGGLSCKRGQSNWTNPAVLTDVTRLKVGAGCHVERMRK